MTGTSVDFKTRCKKGYCTENLYIMWMLLPSNGTENDSTAQKPDPKSLIWIPFQ